MNLTRRQLLRNALLAAVPLAARQAAAQGGARQTPKSPDSTKVAADRLDDPALVGRASAPLGRFDNDPGVIAIERRLRCTCGCTLDVYTCRTTDFTCTYSPAMHADVVARVERGETPEQIVQAFVAADGESVLMSPPAKGFNLAGYLAPGLAMTAAGVALAAYLARHRDAGPAAQPAAAGGVAAPPTAEDLERLRRALDDVDS